MPEPLLHFLIPFIGLILCGIDIKKSALIASLAIIPDLDVLFHVHRSITHSIVVIAIVFIPIISIMIIKNSKYLSNTIISMIVLFTHPFLDMFNSFSPILYPLYKNSIHIECMSLINLENLSQLRFIFNIKTLDISIFTRTMDYDTAIFTGMGLAITLIFAISLIISYRSKK